MYKFSAYWLPALLWMILIFSASGDVKSSQRSSRLIGPLVHWLFPQLPPAKVERVVFYVRKMAHVTEYSILAMLLWRARRQSFRGDRRPWLAAHAWFVLGVCALYAATDELHQRFVPGREGRLLDVIIDSSGAVLGIFIVWAFGRWRRRW